jgi:hypothetical protein
MGVSMIGMVDILVLFVYGGGYMMGIISDMVVCVWGGGLIVSIRTQ